MKCYSPIGCYFKPGGGISFTPAGGFFDKHTSIPCGQCIGCRLEKSRQWAVRMTHEAQLHDATCFLTLTYDNEHLPADESLDVEHWKLFAKRLRKHINKDRMKIRPASARPPVKKFRFFHCGEYGDKKGRMHLHAAIFGLDFHEDRKKAKKHKSHSGQENQLYTSATLDRIWGQGECTIGDLTFESAAYIAQYVTKKLNSGKKLTVIDPRKQPYATMSRRPGIGAEWFKKFYSDVYPRDEVVVRGKKQKPPIYYDKLLEAKDPELMARIKRARRKASLNDPDNTPERRKVIEECKELYSQHFSRDSAS